MRSVKATSQPWPIPPSWRWAALGEIAITKSRDASRLKSAEPAAAELPWLKACELRDSFISSTSEGVAEPTLLSSGATIFPKGTVCIARSGSSAGRLGVLNIAVVASTAICGILPSDSLWPEYLFRFLQFKRSVLAARKSRAYQPYITLSALRATSIPVPPINQQRRLSAEISSRLAHIDARSSQLDRTMSDLKRHRSSMFSSVLNQRLALTGWLPHGIDARTKAIAGSLPAQIFSDAKRRRKQGSIARPPDGWTVKAAQKVCSEITYGWDVQPAYEVTGHRLVTTRGVNDGTIDFTGCGFISDSLFERHRRHCSPQNDDIILVGGGRTVGRTALVKSETPFAIGRHILLMRPLICSRFLFHWLRSEECQRWIEKGTGPARTQVRLSEIRQIPVLVPPADEQAQIVAEIDRRLSLIDRLEAAILALQRRAELIRIENLNSAFRGTLPTERQMENSNRRARRIGQLQSEGNAPRRTSSRLAE